MNEACHIYEGVVSHIRMRPVTHMNESCHRRVTRTDGKDAAAADALEQI